MKRKPPAYVGQWDWVEATEIVELNTLLAPYVISTLYKCIYPNMITLRFAIRLNTWRMINLFVFIPGFTDRQCHVALTLPHACMYHT